MSTEPEKIATVDNCPTTTTYIGSSPTPGIGDLDTLQTGDIILCHSNGKGPTGLDPGIDGMIEFATHSMWEHAGIVIRDPWWIKEPCLCIFQSGPGPNGYGDIMTGKKSGVTINHLTDFLQNRENIYVRQLKNFEFNQDAHENFYKAFETAHGKPYDTNWCSWAGVGCGSFFRCMCCSRWSTPKTTETFWCSALVAFMYAQMGWFDQKLDWSCQTPENLAEADAISPLKLGPIWQLK